MEKGDVKKASALMMSAVFIGFLLYFVVGYFAIMPSYVSYVENRRLAHMPELSASSLADGSFEKGLEGYLSDHLTSRNELVRLQVDISRAMGRNYQRGVYLSDDGYYIRESHLTKESAALFAEALNEFAEESDAEVDLLVIPETGIMLRDKIPYDYLTRSFDKAEESVEFLSELLSEKVNFYYAKEPVRELIDSGVQAFYRTDHHWTTECVKAVFDWYADKSGLAVPEIEYEKHEVKGYYGVLYSLAPSLFAEGDVLNYYTNPDGKYSVVCNDEAPKDTVIDDVSEILEKDKYKVFFGGDRFQIQISSNAPEGNILVLQDSFGRAFLPFLADSCSDIYAIDTRHFDTKEKPVKELAGELGAEKVLLIYYTDSLSYEQFRRY